MFLFITYFSGLLLNKNDVNEKFFVIEKKFSGNEYADSFRFNDRNLFITYLLDVR